MKGCLSALLLFFASMASMGLALLWIITVWQTAHQLSLGGIATFCVCVVVFLIACSRIEQAGGKLMDRIL